MTYIIRPMQDEDIPQVIEIDREAFPTQWPQPSYTSLKRELRNQLAHYIVVYKQRQDNQEAVSSKTSKGFWNKFPWLKFFISDISTTSRQAASISQEYIVGYAGFWTMVDEAHLTTIAVRDAYRRRGLGELLLISVIDAATRLNARIITLEVRISNKPAQLLYEKYGFSSVGIRHGYYSDNREDALLMSTDTITSASFQGRFQQLKQTHSQKWGGVFKYNS